MLGYHLVNLGIHIACVVLTFALVRSLGLSAIQAGVGALVFGLHPVQAEVVNYISSRSESLAAMWYLVSLLAYMLWRDRHVDGAGRMWLLAVSVAAFALGLLSKSTALTLPVALILFEIIRRPSGAPPSIWGTVRPHVPHWLVVGAYLAVVASMVATALGQPVRPISAQMFTQLKAGVYYLYLLVVPVRLTVEHQFTVSESFLQAPVVLSATALASAGLILVRGYGRRWWQGGLLLLLAALAMAPGSLVPLNVLVNEHRLYLSAAFLAPVAAGCLLQHGPRAEAGGVAPGGELRRSPRWMMLALGIALLGILAHQRSSAWVDELTLWRDAVAKAPGMYRSHMHLGGALEAVGDADGALQSFERAADLAPGVAEVHYNRANALRELGHVQEARAAYHRSLRLRPDYARSLYNLSALELESGDPEAAVDLLRRATASHPRAAEAWRRLGVAHRAQGQLDEAVVACHRSLEIDPQAAETHYNLGNVEFDRWHLSDPANQQGRTRERLAAAARAYERAVALEPGHASAWYNLADALLRLGEADSAERVCLDGLRLHPQQAKLYYVLAQAQEAVGKPRAALFSYRRLLEWAGLSRGMRQIVVDRIAVFEAGEGEK